MRAVLTVIGKDTVGILAAVSVECAERNVNIIDVTQTVLDGLFCMIMMCDISGLNMPFDKFSDVLSKKGSEMGMSINIMHEDIFNSMHRI